MDESLGARLRAGRKRARLTQQAVADDLGVRRSGVAEWEGDVHRPQDDKLARLAELYGDDLRTYAAAPDTPDSGTGHPDEDLPGYWRGFIAGVRRTAGRAMREIEDLSADLDVMIAAGRRWEAATVRDAARKAAEEAARLSTRPVDPGALNEHAPDTATSADIAAAVAAGDPKVRAGRSPAKRRRSA